MKIALIGYGRMGREIEKLALEHNHTIGTIIDNEQDWLKNQKQLETCDVAIEFSIPLVVVQNLLNCFKSGVPVVTGTTGWGDRIEEVKSACSQYDGTLFHASNFSIGVNIFFEINRRLAAIMNRHQEYDVTIEETHHIQKLDSPSGTAITLANDIIRELDRKQSWQNSLTSKPEQLMITSFREGTVTGIHTVDWISEADTISVRHEANNRKGYASGALLAAEFIVGRKGVYGMKDLLQL